MTQIKEKLKQIDNIKGLDEELVKRMETAQVQAFILLIKLLKLVI